MPCCHKCSVRICVGQNKATTMRRGINVAKPRHPSASWPRAKQCRPARKVGSTSEAAPAPRSQRTYGKYSILGIFCRDSRCWLRRSAACQLPDLCAVERIGGAHEQARIGCAERPTPVVESVPESVGGDNVEMEAIFGHIQTWVKAKSPGSCREPMSWTSQEGILKGVDQYENTMPGARDILMSKVRLQRVHRKKDRR